MQSTRATPNAPRISAAALSSLRHRASVPGYRRTELSTGVVHLGVGNFHRAHQAMYFDQLAELGVTGWGLTGVGLRSRAMKDALSGQDNLFTVVAQDGSSRQARVVGAMLEYLYAPRESAQVLAALTAADTHLVTLTLTGDGYPVDAAGRIASTDPDILHDLARPGTPKSAWGYLVEALSRRRAAGHRGFTVLSCDNLADSGDTARSCTLAFAGARDPELARWIDDQVSFPNAMVDRITPATTGAQRAMVGDQLGFEDRAPVFTEQFSQWVVQDSFGDHRPPLDRVGVQFVGDVEPYKLMKTRLLNGSHCALGYLGTLNGHRSTSEAMADPVVSCHIRRLMEREVAPLLPALPGIDVADYQRTLLQRFANPAVADPLSRLCGRGSTKMPSYLLPSLHAALRAGRPHELLTLSVAAWMRYLRGTDLQGRPVEVNDAQAPVLRELALAGGADPRPLLGQTRIFGDLRANSSFVDSLRAALAGLDRVGLPPTQAG